VKVCYFCVIPFRLSFLSSLIKQNQLRQADLERENAELVASLTAQQKEIVRLQHNIGNNVGALSNIGMNTL